MPDKKEVLDEGLRLAAGEVDVLPSQPTPREDEEAAHKIKFKQSVKNLARPSMSPASPLALELNTIMEEDDDDSPGEDSVGFFTLFRFATCLEWLWMSVGVVLAAMMGLCIPLGIILYGEFTMMLVDRTTEGITSTPIHLLAPFGGGHVLVNATPSQQYDALLDDSLAYGIATTSITLIQLLCGIISVDLFNMVARRQIGRIREKLLEAVLSQDIAWYDTNTTMNFATTVTEDIEKMKDGIGEKITIFVYLVSSFVYAVIVAFAYGWKLTLVVLSSSPVIILTTAIVAKVQSTLTVRELQTYSVAGMVAEEVLGSIRTVVAFAGEQKEKERYEEKLKPARNVGNLKGLYSGLGSGVMWLIIYLSYAIAFYYGVTLIVADRELHPDEREYTPAVLIVVFFGVLMGAQNLGMTAPHIEAFTTARGSAGQVFKVINRQSDIDSMSPEGRHLPDFKGDIVFENVHFQYPSRPDIKILQGLNLKIRAGQTVALVGPSGCGKSTCLQLVQRLYDPEGGRVSLDGHDLRNLNVQWLRRHIGVVGQEPVLFACSIRENISYGKPDCTFEEIKAATKAANCEDFINKLPLKYDTLVGERGAQLSGGQKQRLAIARALIRKPRLLLLDEATSALDLHSQAKVQAALDRAQAGRTTLVVSHRLSTTVNADLIVYMDKGKVVEQGTHRELMSLRQNYYRLVQADQPAPAPETIKPVPEVVIPKPLKPRKSLAVRKSMMLRKSMTGGPPTERGSVDSFDDDDMDEDGESKSKSSLLRIMSLNAPEWPHITLGCLASLALGATLPAFAFIFGDIYGSLALSDGDEVISETVRYCVWFIVLGVVAGGCTFIQMLTFSISGSRLTYRLRIQVFEAMMRQEMGWFDQDKNSVGALGSRLAGDCSAVQGATGSRVGSMLQACSTLILGVLLAFAYSWKMTLVSIITVPIIFGAVTLEARIMGGESSTSEKAAMETATKLATEAISNIRTIVSLGQERAVMKRYMLEIDKVNRASATKTRLRGFVFSFGQCAPLIGYAVSLSYGGVLVAEKELEYKNVIKVSEALIFGAWMLGQALSFAPNFNAARISAVRIFALFDREPQVATSPNCLNLEKWEAKGDIKYSRVEFTYPTRPGIQILRKLSLSIKAGQRVALVGGSGCGKSTCIQLIQRLYDPIEGYVTLDDKDITEMISVPRLRAQLGIVSQEPVLFDRTIGENIMYGDNTRAVCMHEVVQAAKDANIHNFISNLPLGYDTRLGLKGTQLSGGQKQRIAIARALVRNPRILLLDEATSALDTQSEKVVQEALDRAGEGRTCITIAHRLSTIRNSNMICVLEKGRVAESGTHNELIAANGLYAKLHALQAQAV